MNQRVNITYWVPLDSQLTIGFLNLIIIAGARESKDFVVIVTVELLIHCLFIHSVNLKYY
jgi:hypothetical protein